MAGSISDRSMMLTSLSGVLVVGLKIFKSFVIESYPEVFIGVANAVVARRPVVTAAMTVLKYILDSSVDSLRNLKL